MFEEDHKEEVMENDTRNLQDILDKLDISEIPKPDRQIGEDDEEDEGPDQDGELVVGYCVSGVTTTAADTRATEDDTTTAEDDTTTTDDTTTADESSDTDWREVAIDQPAGGVDQEVPREEANGNADLAAEGSIGDVKGAMSSAELQNAKEAGNVKTQRKTVSPLKLLKRLTSKEKRNKKKSTKLDTILMDVRVEALPQTFIVKYMGVKEVFGLWGIQHTRGPLEELVAEIQEKTKQEEWEDLPLLVMRISQKGLQLKEHNANTSKAKITKGIVPIEFVSYGVQDIKYTRVFSFILVKELSSRTKRLECHSYVCDSTTTTRRLALSVSLAFQEYASSLKGKPYKFQVDLRSTKELELDLTTKAPGDECEA